MTTRNILAATFLLFALAVYPTLDFAAHDIRMLQTFSLDEAAFANQVREMVDSGSFAVDGFTYGAIYPSLGYLIVSLWGLFAEPTDTAIIITLRLISLLAAIGTALVTYRIAQSISRDRETVLIPAILLSTPLLLNWTVEIHPDVLQLFFLTLALQATITLSRHHTLRSAVAAGSWAGLAMGTKYGGGFMMPTVLLGISLGIPGNLKQILQDRRFWISGALSAIAFIAVWAITNPYAVRNFAALQADLNFAGRIVSEAKGGMLSWFGVLAGPWIAPYAGTALPLAVLLVIHKDWLRDRTAACLLFWYLTYLGFLLTSVSFVADQYLLPLVPASLLIVEFYVINHATHLTTERGRQIALVIVVVCQTLLALPSYSERTVDESENPVIAAGLWLSDTYPDDTTILYDTYAYVPQEFTLADTYFGLSYSVIEIYRPDLVITRSSIRDRYADPERSDHFRLTDDASKQADFLYLDPQRYRDIHYTYKYLSEGRTAYAVARDFDDVTIYKRQNLEPQAGKRDRWTRISEGQKSGGVEAGVAAQAYAAFGDLHLAAKNWKEAKTQYGRSIGLDRANIVTQYNYAVALAGQNSVDAAEEVIRQMEAMTQTPEDLWTKLGWDYYEMGRYERSRRASRKALELAPDTPYPRFNEALTYLVEGRIEEADRAYQAALDRHPLPEPTADLLRGMIRNQNLTGDARALAERVLSHNR